MADRPPLVGVFAEFLVGGVLMAGSVGAPRPDRVRASVVHESTAGEAQIGDVDSRQSSVRSSSYAVAGNLENETDANDHTTSITSMEAATTQRVGMAQSRLRRWRICHHGHVAGLARQLAWFRH
jgi:hypothetical protein